MPARFLVPALLAILSHAAQAAPACLAAEPWQCVGKIELATTNGTFRMSFFDNDEMLAEIDHAYAPQRMLATRATFLYLGVPAADIGFPARNPFTMFELRFGPAIRVLGQAFPAGPASVPTDKVTQHASMGGSHATIEARREADGSVTFGIVSEAMPSMRGRFSSTRPQPWFDSTDISGWVTQTGAQFRQLGDVRRGPRKPVQP